jgi:hypothetical protein
MPTKMQIENVSKLFRDLGHRDPFVYNQLEKSIFTNKGLSKKEIDNLELKDAVVSIGTFLAENHEYYFTVLEHHADFNIIKQRILTMTSVDAICNVVETMTNINKALVTENSFLSQEILNLKSKIL